MPSTSADASPACSPPLWGSPRSWPAQRRPAGSPTPTTAPRSRRWRRTSPSSTIGRYTPVPNAGLEQGNTGWLLTGGARVVSGNEPWKIGGTSHSNALDLPGGSSAITAPICIDETYPHFRLFVRNTGSLKSALKIEVLYYDTKGNVTNAKPVEYKPVTTAVATDRPGRHQRLHLKDHRHRRARRVPLHPDRQGRPLPDRRRLRRPPRPRLEHHHATRSAGRAPAEQANGSRVV